MDITRRPLKNAKQTGRLMHKMVDAFYLDMAPYASLSYPEFFDLMKNIPFQPDPPGIELLKRPLYTMRQIGPGGDCDDKSICVASWAKIAGIPCRFVGVGNRKGKVTFFGRILLSHVYTELYINGDWLPFDTTYSVNILGKTLQKFDKYTIL